jgi:hypothetical protein
MVEGHEGMALKKNVTISILGLLSLCGWEIPGGERRRSKCKYF